MKQLSTPVSLHQTESDKAPSDLQVSVRDQLNRTGRRSIQEFPLQESTASD